MAQSQQAVAQAELLRRAAKKGRAVAAAVAVKVAAVAAVRKRPSNWRTRVEQSTQRV